MDNLHIMMPGYGNGTTPEPMFTPAFLQCGAVLGHPIPELGHDQQFDALQLVESRVPHGLDHRRPGGVPYEDMIELCNEAQKDMRINVPTLATPAFVQDLRSSSTPIWTRTSMSTWSTAMRPGIMLSPSLGILTAAEANPLVTQTPMNR